MFRYARLTRTGLVHLFFLAMLLTFLVGCEDAGEQDSARPPVPVTLAAVESRTLEETVRGIGTLRANQTVEVRPEINGKIVTVAFKEGQKVEEDQILFKLDTRKLSRQLSAAKASLDAAEARRDDAVRRMKQTERLFREQVATEDDLDQARNNLRAARSEVERLESEVALMRERLDDAQVKAPLAGVISEALVDAGDYVQAGDKLCTLYGIDVLEVDFSLPERYAGQVEEGQPVSLAAASHPDKEFEGTLIFVSPAINEQTRDFLVKAEVRNPSAVLKPGAFVTAVLTVDVRENRPVIPEEALIATGEGYFVFVVNSDNTARRQDVSIGLRNPGIVEITKGLSPGQRVVRSGHMRVTHGAPLKLIEETVAASRGSVGK